MATPVVVRDGCFRRLLVVVVAVVVVVVVLRFLLLSPVVNDSRGRGIEEWKRVWIWQIPFQVRRIGL